MALKKLYSSDFKSMSVGKYLLLVNTKIAHITSRVGHWFCCFVSRILLPLELGNVDENLRSPPADLPLG